MQRLSPDAAFNFTEDDLKENRRGKLSAAQMNILRADAIRMTAIIGACILAVSVLTLISLRGASAGELEMVAFFALGVAGFAVYYFIGRTELALAQREVEAITGEVEILLTVNGSPFLKVGDKMFHLTQTEARAFQPKAAYTIYRVSLLRKIVAIESYGGDPYEKASQESSQIVIDDRHGAGEALRT